MAARRWWRWTGRVIKGDSRSIATTDALHWTPERKRKCGSATPGDEQWRQKLRSLNNSRKKTSTSWPTTNRTGRPLTLSFESSRNVGHDEDRVWFVVLPNNTRREVTVPRDRLGLLHRMSVQHLPRRRLSLVLVEGHSLSIIGNTLG